MWGQLVGSVGTFDLRLPVCRIGRISAKADIVIQKPWISALQCTIALRGGEGIGDKSVWLTDMSSNGVYVNGDMVGKSFERQIFENDEIYFTKPSLHTPNVEPTFFRFRFADQAQSIHVTPRKAKRSAPPTPDSKGSAKKVCVAASSSSTAQRDELVVGTESMLKANQELRQRLVDAGNRERDLMAQLQDMLTTVQLREQEMDKLRDDVAKARARAVEDDHLRVEYTALESKHKQAEAKCVDVEMCWAKDKEVLKQCQDELAATLRSTLSLNHVVDVLKEELQEAQAKASSATQRVRQLESDHQKLAHQLDMVHRTSDHEHETSRGAKEEVLVMKARFASARNAFRHMQTCMVALGEQIDIVPALLDYDDEATHGDGDEEDGDEETQCVLAERFARAEGEEEVEGRQQMDDQHASPRSDDDDDATKQLVDTTEPATLYVKEDKEVEEKDGGAVRLPTNNVPAKDDASTSSSTSSTSGAETSHRWLQLKKDSPVASVDDCGLFDESQDVRHQS